MNTSQPMISGCCPTIYVSNLDEAVKFYTETLGFKLMYQAPDAFAMINTGEGGTIGLHPRGEKSPKAGTHGSIQLGLSVNRPIAEVVEVLQSKGVVFRGPVIDDSPVKLAFFGDLDDNDLYLCEYQH